MYERGRHPFSGPLTLSASWTRKVLMTTEVQPKLTLREKVEVLREPGLVAFGWVEPGVVEFFPIATILFPGNE